MKREVAFKGFYRTLREIQGYEAQAKADGHSCNISNCWKMAEMRARRYCKSLVFEHGWQDIHTKKYYK
ncbi:hypothetical protein ERICI_01361 [Paenibacillus larvae subsp. larvae]|uniref:Uncharacterized protein n=4 Tax=Vegasvirus vegas TaxID=2034999 RepID=A0A0K2CZ45_9CAUD|nr:hypothetical protein VEGAS_29 [Paenibacillus phage Vegas]ALA12763.1 hypothetical protein HAYLEY_29 [Paenibacillus phage Hayley]ALA12848.1 hypothetical protein VADIM_29 [Paenibacillus phage Vadim]ALA12934.1 hypothetical protein DIANE_29 [Paenibacillus phage Diane]AQR77659.1 hypothetical protein BXP28_10260 [Paenibacillus larvae subsp. larvae]ETK25802.1 hypothetical protein ERIC1_3c01250 [Paenibacillus larvae subsp. larvae DSM 25719]UYE92053.1 hypothetical protein LUNBUN_29 [Paenibacillus ph